MNQNIPQKNEFKKLSLQELEKLYDDAEFIPYSELLRTYQWESKRNEILARDNFHCCNCNGFNSYYNKDKQLVWGICDLIIWTDLEGNTQFSVPTKPAYQPDKEYQMHVHHKKYIKNRFPWQYENMDLVSLCNHCHIKIHLEETIPIFDENNREIFYIENCHKCNGKGYFPEYAHVEGGICFKCRGTKINIELIDKKLL